MWVSQSAFHCFSPIIVDYSQFSSYTAYYIWRSHTRHTHLRRISCHTCCCCSTRELSRVARYWPQQSNTIDPWREKVKRKNNWVPASTISQCQQHSSLLLLLLYRVINTIKIWKERAMMMMSRRGVVIILPRVTTRVVISHTTAIAPSRRCCEEMKKTKTKKLGSTRWLLALFSFAVTFSCCLSARRRAAARLPLSSLDTIPNIK